MMMNFELCKIFKINKQKKEVKQRRKIYVKKMIIEEFLIFTETHVRQDIYLKNCLFSHKTLPDFRIFPKPNAQCISVKTLVTTKVSLFSSSYFLRSRCCHMTTVNK